MGDLLKFNFKAAQKSLRKARREKNANIQEGFKSKTIDEKLEMIAQALEQYSPESSALEVSHRRNKDKLTKTSFEE